MDKYIIRVDISDHINQYIKADYQHQERIDVARDSCRLKKDNVEMLPTSR